VWAELGRSFQSEMAVQMFHIRVSGYAPNARIAPKERMLFMIQQCL